MLLALLIPFSVSQAQQGPDPSFPTPPRISLLDGQASFWRPGAENWAPAVLNTPLAPGDSLYTGPDTTAEVQIGPHTYVRLRDSTQLQVSDVESDYMQIKLTAGEASLDVREIAPGQTIEVDTPNAAYTVQRRGYYRLSVDEDSTSFVTRRGGAAEVTPAGGGTTRIEPGEELVASGTDEATLRGYAAPPLDEWDRWNYERTDWLLESISARYVPAGVYGASELDQYGRWRNVEQYGPVWIPTAVPAGWTPYSAGHWIYDPLFGWTWVDNAPWGYAPFHYGRWVFVGGYWAWAPGPRVARPVYAPALVAWYHGGPAGARGGVSVGWVALGWGEPVSPWWGPSHFAGRPYWGGWGGPRVINRTVISNTTVVTNVTHITYVNAQVHNAVIETNSERLGRGDHDFRRAAPDDVRRWRPSERGADVRPSAASLVPVEGHAVRPPRQDEERRVVALHPPRDPGERLHAAGLRPTEKAGPPPRIASPATSPAASPAQLPAAASPRERERGREQQTEQRRGPNGDRGYPPAAVPRPTPQANVRPNAVPQQPPRAAQAERAPQAERVPQAPPPRFSERSARAQPQPQQQAPGPESATRSRPAPEQRARSAPAPEQRARTAPAQEQRARGAPAQERGRQAAAENRKLPGESAMKLRPHPEKGKKEERPREERPQR
ncbi:MAG: DUF6600 domain-containing protein [Betaproteobacteria bacterium]